MPKHEPLLSHLHDALSTWPLKGAAANRAEELKLALGQFCGHNFLDALTHPGFTGQSPFDVYELDSLEKFPERVRELLASRAAAVISCGDRQLRSGRLSWFWSRMASSP
jgi:hypothetical protein